MRIGSLDSRAERGSAPVEFVLVGAMVTMLAVAVVQLGLALHVRNTVLDAAAEGARFAALADNGLADGVARADDLITTALGAGLDREISATTGEYRGHPCAIVTVRATLPLVGLIGIDSGLEVVGHAAIETLD